MSAVPPSHQPAPTPVPPADPTQPIQPDKTLGDLFGELTGEFTSLVRDEVQLAKLELTESAKKAGRAGGLLGGAGVAGLMALLLLSFAAAWGLAAVIPTGWAFFAVAVAYGVAAAVLGLSGKKEIKDLNPTPEQTVETVKEDVAWARKQIS